MRRSIVFLIVFGVIGITVFRKRQERKAEAMRIAARQDSIRFADSVTRARAEQEERIAAERQALADQFAAASANAREQRRIYNDTVTRTPRQCVQWTPGATNRPPLD